MWFVWFCAIEAQGSKGGPRGAKQSPIASHWSQIRRGSKVTEVRVVTVVTVMTVVSVVTRLLTNRGPDKSGRYLISIRQLPDQSGSWLILPWWLPDRSGGCLTFYQAAVWSIRQLPDFDQAAAWPIRPGLILIRQLPDRSGSRLIFIFSDFL